VSIRVFRGKNPPHHPLAHKRDVYSLKQGVCRTENCKIPENGRDKRLNEELMTTHRREEKT